MLHTANFIRLQEGIPVEVFLREMSQQPLSRESFPGINLGLPVREKNAHREAVHYYLRRADASFWTKKFLYRNLLKTVPTENMARLPELARFLEAFAGKERACLGRAYISILEPHGKVRRHWDRGLYHVFLRRYHLVLESEGTLVRVGREAAVFHQGELWRFNNLLPHEFSHDSAKERIHVIFDLRPRSLKKRIENMLFWLYCYCYRNLPSGKL